MATYKNKLWLILLLFLTSFCGFSQDRTVEVYNYDRYGIRDISPSKIIEIKEERTEIYDVDKYGIKSITPTETIINNKLYEVDKNNLQQLLPMQGWQNSIIPSPIELNSVPIFNLPVLSVDF